MLGGIQILTINKRVKSAIFATAQDNLNLIHYSNILME